jgi:hypothetical protein
MARALDAGSDDAFTGRTSELRGKEKDPQPDRVGFKQSLPSPAEQGASRLHWRSWVEVRIVTDERRRPGGVERAQFFRAPDGPIAVRASDSDEHPMQSR